MHMSAIHPVVAQVTERIRERSRQSRAAYLAQLDDFAGREPRRTQLSCTNLAHGFAACNVGDKQRLRGEWVPNLAIVSAYNDMLSAHQPYESYPQVIKKAAEAAGGVAQFAGGVPAMCDGVTQGRPGMELSLFSRDTIAMATAIALSHDMFDAAVCLGICDKIVPGLLIGALHYGHLPTVFIPGGPMPSGMSNDEKARIRQAYTAGQISREELLEAESQSYHSPGTCTFYGTANSNQFLMDLMGLHLPGAAFVAPNTPLREALTAAATRRALALNGIDGEYTPIGRLVDEHSIVNAIVGLLATGGSTNHTMHFVAVARAAGLVVDWDDFDNLSAVVPLLARMYPNGAADVNHFHAAGGTPFLIRELRDAGLLHDDVQTILGRGLAPYTRTPRLDGDELVWDAAPAESGDTSVLRPVSDPFSPDGGLRRLTGNLGRAVIKVSAVKPKHRIVSAPAKVFSEQNDVLAAFKAGELNQDVIVVVRGQGPKANGMPELHKLTPSLSILQDKGFHVALVTDGRMSGASGKVPAAIHVTPEAISGGPLAKVRDGDRIVLDSEAGSLHIDVDEAEWAARDNAPLRETLHGFGRELFTHFRAAVTGAEEGAAMFPLPGQPPSDPTAPYDDRELNLHDTR